MPDLLNITARLELTKEQVTDYLKDGVLIVNDARRRPRYFNGRFLAARDLTRDQTYVLSRQADLGRAVGWGVIRGMGVRALDDKRARLHVTAGHGVTPAGELVVVPDAFTLDLTSIPTGQRLDAHFGLVERPQAPARTRSGLFILALRPVEFTANPVTAYPTSVTGQRTLEHGDIIEGVAFTLIPYPTPDLGRPSLRHRAQVAREIFVDGSPKGSPEDALPLAMLALDHGAVVWVDPWMVRREAGSDRGVSLGFSGIPKATREASVLQYKAHLQDVEASPQLKRIVAAEHFQVLPPIGPLPAGVIDTSDFAQRFFPPEVDVELTVIPHDELPALISESLALPPIDLRLSGEALASTSVLVLILVERGKLRELQNDLQTLRRSLTDGRTRLLRDRSPMLALQQLQLAHLPQIIKPEVDTEDQAWARAVGAALGPLWYVRRRSMHYSSELFGEGVPLTGDDRAEEQALLERLAALNLKKRYTNLKRRGTTYAEAELVRTLASVMRRESPLLLLGAIQELESKRRVDKQAALEVATRFTKADFGRGVALLEQREPSKKVREALVAGGLLPEADELLRAAADGQEGHEETLNQLLEALADGPSARNREAIDALRRKVTS